MKITVPILLLIFRFIYLFGYFSVYSFFFTFSSWFMCGFVPSLLSLCIYLFICYIFQDDNIRLCSVIVQVNVVLKRTVVGDSD